MSWQIVAIATAQHYLGEINERLATIERSIEDIHWLLQEEKKTELTAAINLLCQYRDAIARGSLHAGKTAAINNQFEDIERTCLAIGGLARAKLQKRLKELEHLDVREWTARGDSAERAKKWVKDNREALDSSSSRNRVASWHVRLNLRCLVIGTFYADESNKLSRRLHVACKHSARCGRASWIRWDSLEGDPRILSR